MAHSAYFLSGWAHVGCSEIIGWYPSSTHIQSTSAQCAPSTGGWWHFNWGRLARGNGYHSILSAPDIIMSRPPLSSLHCSALTYTVQGYDCLRYCTVCLWWATLR